MTTTPATPGYSGHLEIFFATNKNGRKVAYRWSPRQFRSFPMPVLDAEIFVALGQATEIPGNPMKP